MINYYRRDLENDLNCSQKKFRNADRFGPFEFDAAPFWSDVYFDQIKTKECEAINKAILLK